MAGVILYASHCLEYAHFIASGRMSLCVWRLYEFVSYQTEFSSLGYIYISNYIPFHFIFFNTIYFVLILFFFAIFRVLSHESAINVHKGRQTRCNFRSSNDLLLISGANILGEHSLTTTTFTAVPSLNRRIQKVHQKDLTTLFTSFQPSAFNAKASSWPLAVEHFTQIYGRYRYRCRCRRRGRQSQRQACTTNQKKPPIESGTITTNTATPNYNYHLKKRKTYSYNTGTSKNKDTSSHHSHSSCDDNCDCINSNIDTNKTEWYIRLASNCYRNGFQLHVNHLDEWSKHPSLAQRKPTQVPSLLRLPSSALQPIRTNSVASEKACVSHNNQSISTNRDLVVNTSNVITQQPIRADCERINLNNKSDSTNVLNDCIERKSQHQQPNDTDDSNRIYVKNLLKSSDTHHSNRPIDESSKLAIIDRKISNSNRESTCSTSTKLSNLIRRMLKIL